MTIRVLLADDQPVVREGLRMILESHDDLEVVAEACDGQAAVELAAQLRPDLVLMDIRMPVLNGIDATRQITRMGDAPNVLVLTTYGVDEYVYEALRAGAGGFALKTDPPEHLVHAVRVVAGGEALLAPAITRRLIDAFTSGPRRNGDLPKDLERLTARERDVLLLVARGLSNEEIARELVVSHGTVKTHVGRLLAKLGLRDRVQAVVFAYEHGLVEVNPRP